MARFLHRVGRFSRRHPWPVITVWLALLVLTSAGAALLSVPLGNQFRIPGAGFQQVMDTLKAEMPSAAGDSGTIVVTSSGRFTVAQQTAVRTAAGAWSHVGGVAEATDPFAVQNQLDAAAAKLSAGRAQLESANAQLAAGRTGTAAASAQLDQAQRALDTQRAALPAGTPAPAAVTAAQQRIDAGRAELAARTAQLQAGGKAVAEQERTLRIGERQAALTRGTRLVSADGRAALVQVRLVGHASALTTAERDRLRQIGAELGGSGVSVDFGSTLVSDLNSVIGPTEIVGVVVAGGVLLVMLGTLLAAGLPLLMALIGVAVGIGATLAASGVIEMNSVTPALALMLGLAVGIDYSLFIINRHRIQLLSGMPLDESIPRANGTAGNAVVFAGLTVIIALAALTVVGIPFLAVMGLAGALTVAVAVAVAVTLTPAVLAVLGHRVLSRKAWQAHGFTATGDPVAGAAHLVDHDETDAQPVRVRHGWGELVTGHPWASTVAAVALLALCAIPAASLRLGLPDGGSEPVGSTAYRAYTAAARYFGEGANGPIVAVATLPAGLDAVSAQEKELDVAERLGRVGGLVRVVPIGVSPDRRLAALEIVPQHGPGKAETGRLVASLRATAPGIRAATGAEVGLTGLTVANIDISAKLAGALGPYLAVVVGLSLVILVMVFRSLVVPVVATGGFLLSIAASFGAVVAVYQWGWLKGFFGVSSPEAVLSFLPTLLIGVLFGLAMDYQMFLVTGMREAYAHGQDARQAVLTGFHHGRRVVAAAALIMIAVFSGFVHAQLTMVRPIGFGLAVGVLVDAFVVRMTLTPAVMHLLGARAWWLPAWLDRIVPDVDVEGSRLKLPDGPDGPDPAGSGTAGSGTAGSGTAGSGTAGSGTAGSGTAGSGTADGTHPPAVSTAAD
jgi:RND superfamily putative drug exporter